MPTRTSHRIITALLLVLTVAGAAPVAVSAARPADRALLDQLDARRVARHAQTGRVRFLEGRPGRPVATAAQLGSPPGAEVAAARFLERFGRLLGADGGRGLRRAASVKADRGRTFVRFQQQHRGVPVLGGELVVQVSARGDVISANGELATSLSVPTTPRLSPAAARRSAVEATARVQRVRPRLLRASRPSLWVYDPAILAGPRRGFPFERLVWRVEVTAARKPVRDLVLVDAMSGSIVLRMDQLDAALDRKVCDANNTATKVPCTSPYARVEGGAASGITDVNQAYDHAGDAYDFFFDHFGRDSLDDAGMSLVSTTRRCETGYPCPFDNAYWDGSQMVYGQGFAAADDVVGHELTHGVTQFTSRLFYYYQSGAINEALSDIFGEFIDLTNGTGSDASGDRWLLGEDLPASIGVIRDMENPPTFGDPDRMTSANYTADVNETDGGGVHTNSGVANKAAFLMTDGGTFNGFTITGLGITKAAAVWYEAAAYLLTSAGDYADLWNGLRQACTNRVGGAEGITAPDCTSVNRAVDATEMDKDPTVAGAAPRRAAVCPSGQTPSTIWFDDLEDTSSGNWTKGQASGSPSAWYYPQNTHPYGALYDQTYASSGDTNIWGDDPDARTDSWIAMADGVGPLPAGAYLHFRHAFGFDDIANPKRNYDGGLLEYNVGSGWVDAGAGSGELPMVQGYNGTLTTTQSDNPLAGRSAFVGESNGYGATRVDLAGLAGESVRFRFRIGTDSVYGDYGWFIDDVRIHTCGGGGGVDTTPPTGSVVIEGGAAATKDAVVDLGFSASDVGGSLAQRYLSNASATSDGRLSQRSEADYSTAATWDLTNATYGGTSACGTKHVYAQFTDDSDNVSSVIGDTIVYDPTVPEAFPPTTDFRLATLASSGPPVPVRVSWPAASDTCSSISYRLQKDVGGGGFTTVTLADATAVAADLLMGTGSSLTTFRVRASDLASNDSPEATGTPFRARVFQDASSSIAYAGTWGTSSSTSFYGGTVRRASASGATAALTTTATDVALVSTRGPNRGKLRVTISEGGTVILQKTVDLYRSSTQYRRIVLAATFLTSASRRIEVRALGTKNASSSGTRVDLDAILVLR